MTMNYTPYLRGIGSDISSTNGKFQSTPCAKFEIKYFECMEAYGKPLGFKKCADQFDDFRECASQYKQMYRIVAMRQERDRQFKAGLLKEHYAQPPPVDSY